MDTCDILIVGAGMAGASAAALLAPHADVIVLEREDQPGYHSTGRSAAVYIESYGNATIRKLNRASYPLLARPPADLADQGFLSPRGELHVADAARLDRLKKLTDELELEPMTAEQALDWVPRLRPEALAGAACERNAHDIDVHALHRAYLTRLQQTGGRLQCRAGVTSIRRDAGGWHVATAAGDFRARVLVNAAGAWADRLAALAGVGELGLQPLRRSAVLIAPPVDVSGWPTVVDIDERFYCKPDAGQLMISPADETPVLPQDVAPDELDLAHGINYFEQTIDIDVGRLEHRWAGLRTFAPDRSPVVGYDPSQEDFFWLAGQGGYGIQTAPAMAAMAAALVQRETLPETLRAENFSADEVDPGRLRR